jgi:hypothetical protein
MTGFAIIIATSFPRTTESLSARCRRERPAQARIHYRSLVSSPSFILRCGAHPRYKGGAPATSNRRPKRTILGGRRVRHIAEANWLETCGRPAGFPGSRLAAERRAEARRHARPACTK